MQLDELDRNILAILMKDANIPYTEIAKKLFVSGGTVHVRMNKLTEKGIVIGSNIRVNYEKLGYDISAFIGVYLNKSSLYEEVVKELQEIPEIVSAHYTTGNYSIFARIICQDTNHLRQILHDKVQQIKGIQRTETFISLEESINRPLDISNDKREVKRDKL